MSEKKPLFSVAEKSILLLLRKLSKANNSSKLLIKPLQNKNRSKSTNNKFRHNSTANNKIKMLQDIYEL